MEESITIVAATVIGLTYLLFSGREWFRRGPGLALSLIAAAYFIYQAALPEPHPRSLRVIMALIALRGVWMQWKAFQAERRKHLPNEPIGTRP